MQVRLLDILADPDTKTWPLELHVFESKDVGKRVVTPFEETNRFCRFYCARKNVFLIDVQPDGTERTLPASKIEELVSLDECYECTSEEIVSGVILSHRDQDVTQWFAIVDGIPVMYPDSLRDEKIDSAFIEKYKDELEKLGVYRPNKEK